MNMTHDVKNILRLLKTLLIKMVPVAKFTRPQSEEIGKRRFLRERAVDTTFFKIVGNTLSIFFNCTNSPSNDFFHIFFHFQSFCVGFMSVESGSHPFARSTKRNARGLLDEKKYIWKVGILRPCILRFKTTF